MKKLLFILAAVLLAACSSEPQYATRAEKLLAEIHNPASDYVMVISHRGDWRNYPENSIPAIESVIRMGVDLVERNNDAEDFEICAFRFFNFFKKDFLDTQSNLSEMIDCIVAEKREGNLSVLFGIIVTYGMVCHVREFVENLCVLRIPNYDAYNFRNDLV